MERIDKIIASQGLYSRSDVKYLVKHKRVAVDGEAVTSSSRKADPEASVITIDGKPLIFKKQLYLISRRAMFPQPRIRHSRPFWSLCRRHIRAESFSLPAGSIRTPQG